MDLPPPLLSLSRLGKSVPGGRQLFNDVTLTLAAGEFVAIMGESGVGKSTLLNLVAGLDTPDTGAVALDGIALGGLDEDRRAELRRRRVGFVFQAFHILPHLTLGQNVALPLVLLRVPAIEAMRRATDLLAAVGLDGRERDYPSQLSGGELQRVAIARAIAHRPALILADEPTGNLDPRTADHVFATLSSLVKASRVAALIATHNMEIAGRMDRRVTIREGKVVEVG